MKKSLIALAIVAALPVAAQADATLSGSVNSVYTQGGAVDTDAAVKIAVEEVLANGMTATASINVLGGTNQGTAGLKGDFGTLTVGSLDSDGAFQHGDAGAIVGDTMTASSSGTTAYGVNYTSGDMSGFDLAIQVNGNTGPSGAVTDDVPATHTAAAAAETKSSQVGLTYDAGNGLKVGYATATDDADNDAKITNGVNGKTNVIGGTYTMDDLEFTLGKQKDMGAKASVQYVYDAFTTKLSYQQSKGATPSSNTLKVGYVQDGITANVSKTKDKKATWDIAYATGDLTLKAASTKKYTAVLDYGNADITLKRDNSGTEGKTSLGYKVSF